MNAPFESPKPPTANKPLWAAVIVLGVAVLAMAATLVRIQTRPEEPRLAVLAPAVPAPTASAPLSLPSAPAAIPASTASSPAANEIILESNRPPAPAKQAQPATKTIVNKTSKPIEKTHTPADVSSASGSPAAAHSPVVTESKPVCNNCGTVEAVTPVQRDGTSAGVGAVAGGVLGAVVGNQMGGGDGKTLATILGAIGGGMAGNSVEKKMKKVTVYEVLVRMEDGSTRTLEQATPASVGAKVVVDGNTLQPASR